MTDQRRLNDELVDAASRGNVDDVATLIQDGADKNYRQGEFKRSPLWAASNNGHADVVKFLINQKCEINACNKYGQTPLYIACAKGYCGVVEELLAGGAYVNIKDGKQSRTPLFAAAENGIAKIVKKLLHCKADVGIRDATERVCLHGASSAEIVRLLVQHDQSKHLDSADCEGNTPLHVACLNFRNDAVKEFIRQNANPLLKNKRGDLAINLAERQTWKTEEKGFMEDLKHYMEKMKTCPKGSQDTEDNSLPQSPILDKVMADKDFFFLNNLSTKFEERHEMVICLTGNINVGKTTLSHQLVAEQVDSNDLRSTEGINVNLDRCVIQLEQNKWTKMEEGKERREIIGRRLMILLEKENSVSEENTKVDDKGDTEDETEKIGSPEVFYERTSSNRSSLGSQTSRRSSTKFEFGSVTTLLQNVNLSLSAADCSQKEITVTILDFAGDSGYYITHQTFYTPRAIYILLFDISKGLGAQIKDKDLDPSKRNKHRTIEFIDNWVNSIVMSTKKTDNLIKFPRIMIVGTHYDLISHDPVRANKIVQDTYSAIRNHFQGKDVSGFLDGLDDPLCINTTEHGDDIEKLKERIIKINMTYPHWGERVPASWLALEYSLTEHSAKEKIVSLDTVKRIDAENEISVAQDMPLGGSQLSETSFDAEEDLSFHSTDSISQFLKYQHDLRKILYFPNISKHLVVLDPLILNEALLTIINSKRFAKNEAVWNALSETGYLSENFLDTLWNQDKYLHLKQHQEFLIQVMIELHLITKPRFSKKEKNEITKIGYYFVPAMLRTSAGCTHFTEDSHTSSTLCFVAKEKFLPWSILHKLFAYCLAFWPVAEGKDGSCRLLYADLAVFDVDNFHSLTIEKKDHAIRVFVSHSLGKEKISRSLCTGIRVTIKEYLEGITNVWESQDGTDDSFYIAVQCRHNDSLLGLVDVASFFDKAADQGKDDRHNDTATADSKQSKEETYLCEIHRSLHNIIEVTQYWFFSKNAVEYEILDFTKPQLESVPSDKTLGRISRLIEPVGKKVEVLEYLVSCLEIPRNFLTGVKHDYHNMFNVQCFQVLARWRMRSPDRTLSHMISLLGENLVLKQAQLSKETTFKGPGKKELEKIPTDTHCRNIATRITPEYYQLGLELDLTRSHLDQIHHDYPQAFDRTYQTLIKWKEKSPGITTANFKTLAIALDMIGSDHRIIEEVLNDSRFSDNS